jgi:UDP-glucose 4-epimerase
MARSRDNILITGGCGFIGRHLVRKLMSEKGGIIIIDDLSNSDKDSVNSDQCNDKTEIDDNVIIYTEDIRNEIAISQIIKEHEVAHCIHLAAMISVDESVQKPHRTLSVNVEGTLSVLEACIMNNVHSFVFGSSAAVYGDPDELPIGEASPIKPISPYGASKIAGEALVSAYASRLKNTFCLRFFNIYGCNQRSSYAGVISKFADRLARGLPLEIYGNGAQTRDFVHIDDVVKAILQAKNYSGIHPTYTLNIGSGSATSINFLANYMKELCSPGSCEIIYIEPELGGIMHSYSDITNAARILEYKPEVSLETGLARMLHANTSSTIASLDKSRDGA